MMAPMMALPGCAPCQPGRVHGLQGHTGTRAKQFQKQMPPTSSRLYSFIAGPLLLNGFRFSTATSPSSCAITCRVKQEKQQDARSKGSSVQAMRSNRSWFCGTAAILQQALVSDASRSESHTSLNTYIFVSDTVQGLCMRLRDMSALHGCQQSRRKGLPAAVKLLSHALTRVRA
jgi:hypothetical protein